MERINFPLVLFLLYYLQLEQVYGGIIYVNENSTWNEAREICKTKFDGTLLDMDAPDTGLLESLSHCLVGNTDVWTGTYTSVSPWWVTVEGCHIQIAGKKWPDNETPMYNLTKASVGRCLEKCQPAVEERIAVWENFCACGNNLDFKSLRKIYADGFCDQSCDFHSFCGGEQTISVYRRSTFTEVPFNRLCGTMRCENTTTIPEARLCDEKFPAICGNSKRAFLDTAQDWGRSMSGCINVSSEGLVGSDASYICRDATIPQNTNGWMGLLRPEFVNQENEPHRVLQMRLTDGVLTKKYVLPSDDTLTFLCETENNNYELSPNDVLCQPRVVPAFTTVHFTSSTANYTDTMVDYPINAFSVELDYTSVRTFIWITIVSGSMVVIILIGVSIPPVTRCIRQKRRRNDIPPNTSPIGNGIYQRVNGNIEEHSYSALNQGDYTEIGDERSRNENYERVNRSTEEHSYGTLNQGSYIEMADRPIRNGNYERLTPCAEEHSYGVINSTNYVEMAAQPIENNNYEHLTPSADEHSYGVINSSNYIEMPGQPTKNNNYERLTPSADEHSYGVINSSNYVEMTEQPTGNGDNERLNPGADEHSYGVINSSSNVEMADQSTKNNNYERLTPSADEHSYGVINSSNYVEMTEQPTRNGDYERLNPGADEHSYGVINSSKYVDMENQLSKK